MPGKWTVDELRVGAVMECAFWANPVAESGYRFRATHLDGRRAPKVVLCDDPRIRAGVPCRVRITAIHKPGVEGRGVIEVELLEALPFRLEGVYLDPIVSKKVQICLESGLNILLDGPQGSGKTVLAKEIAGALGMEFVFFNCAAVVEATDFLATLQICAGPNGQPLTGFAKTPLLTALEDAADDPGRRYLIFLDELNRCQESARNALMPALDATRRVYNPITNTFLAIPDNVLFIAAVNRGHEFTGTFGIDVAQLDRFAPLRVDYLPAEHEVELLCGRHPELGKEIVSVIVDIANQIRRSPEIGAGLSVRATEEACIYVKHPLFEAQRWDVLGQVLQSSFAGRFPGRITDPTSDAGMVWALIERALAERG